MQIGVIFPQTEMAGLPGDVREYAVGVERLGYRHLVAFDHVVGHVSINTMNAGFTDVEQHLDALTSIAARTDT